MAFLSYWQCLLPYRALQSYEVPFANCRSAVLFMNYCPMPIFSRLPPPFSFIRFSVSGFMCSSLIHLDLSFVQGDKNISIRILLHDSHQFSQQHLLKILSFFSIGWFWLLCQRSNDHRCVGSFLGLQFYSINLPVCCCNSTMQVNQFGSSLENWTYY